VDYKLGVMIGEIDAMETNLGRKIDSVATNLTAYQRDTEVHPSVYKVKEDI